MIGRTVDDQRLAVALPDDAAHVREKAAGEVGGQCRGTVLRGEDDMDEQGSEGMRHRLTPRFGARQLA